MQLTLQHHRLWVATVTDEATWEVLCEASQQRQDLGADGVRQSGELVTGSPSQVLLGLSNRRSLLRPVLFGCGGGKLGDLKFEINHLGHRSMVVR
ncbi:hypothetical protein [Yersinia intermedia]|uniref:hypothetical protein n=1 Tax=Yersinia intermedia TaxID=631 RepID=UPI001643BBBB